MIQIEIGGEGILKNGAALTIVRALKEAGFNVNCPSWLQLAQWEPISETNSFIKETANKVNLEVLVNGE